MAQIQVVAQTSRSNFLLYERVDLLVTVTNIGENDLILNNDEKRHPWLSFLLSKHVQQNYMPIRQERDSNFAPVTLKAGENKTLPVNLTPFSPSREEGEYRVAAPSSTCRGRARLFLITFPSMCSRNQNLEPDASGGRFRTHLFSRSVFLPDSDTTELYLRVENPD